MHSWNEQQASWDKLTLRVSGASEMCLAPSWGLTTLSSQTDAAVKAALLSDGGNTEIINCYSPVCIYMCFCACVCVRARVYVYVAPHVLWCLFVCASDCNHSACGDREMRLHVSKHCGWIKANLALIHPKWQWSQYETVIDWHKMSRSHTHTLTRTHQWCERLFLITVKWRVLLRIT